MSKNLIFYEFSKKLDSRSQIMVELKDGSTFNGKLLKIDSYLNILIEKPIITTKNGGGFSKYNFVFLKGEAIKHFRFF